MLWSSGAQNWASPRPQVGWCGLMFAWFCMSCLFGDLTFGGGPKSSLLSIEHEATPHKEDTQKQGCAFIAVKDFSTINELVSAKIYIRQSEDALHFNNQFSPILLRKRIRQSWLLSVNGCRQRGRTTEDWVSWMESILSRSERVTHHCWLWSILRPERILLYPNLMLWDFYFKVWELHDNILFELFRSVYIDPLGRFWPRFMRMKNVRYRGVDMSLGTLFWQYYIFRSGTGNYVNLIIQIYLGTYQMYSWIISIYISWNTYNM